MKNYFIWIFGCNIVGQPVLLRLNIRFYAAVSQSCCRFFEASYLHVSFSCSSGL